MGENMLYDFLLENYGCGEPIFLSELDYEEKRGAALRQEMSRLVTSGDVRRFEQGFTTYRKRGCFPREERFPSTR